MTSEPLTDAISKRICNHMNKDHTDAVLSIVRHYGGLGDLHTAQMTAINSTTMFFIADELHVEIPLPLEISTSEEAHQTLVKMLKEIPS